MKYSVKLFRLFTITLIIGLFLINPINKADAKIEAHPTQQNTVQQSDTNSKISTLFKSKKTKKEKRRWKDLSYGEKSFRMSLFVLLSILLIPIGGIGLLGLAVCSIISIRLGLRSLKEKEEGFSRQKRNQGIAISLIALIGTLLIIGLIYVLFLGILF